jgi:hypothetical protein
VKPAPTAGYKDAEFKFKIVERLLWNQTNLPDVQSLSVYFLFCFMSILVVFPPTTMLWINHENLFS